MTAGSFIHLKGHHVQVGQLHGKNRFNLIQAKRYNADGTAEGTEERLRIHPHESGL